MGTETTVQPPATSDDQPAGPASAEPNYDHWLGRLAWHLELLFRHHEGASELDSAAHRSVAGEMARACLEDYRQLRADQAWEAYA